MTVAVIPAVPDIILVFGVIVIAPMFVVSFTVLLCNGSFVDAAVVFVMSIVPAVAFAGGTYLIIRSLRRGNARITGTVVCPDAGSG